jgi:hypothetical protein
MAKYVLKLKIIVISYRYENLVHPKTNPERIIKIRKYSNINSSLR